MSDAVIVGYSAALEAMQHTGPLPLHELAAMLGKDSSLVDGVALISHLKSAGPDDALCQRFTHALATWDHDNTAPEWAAGTIRNTAERRAVLTTALGLDGATAALFAEKFPYAAADAPIIIADEWEEWRTPQRRAEREFYWAHYRDHLLREWANPRAVSDLDFATEEVVRRLSDPARKMAYQAKGLVVGYVQSGKTANFTGVIAKAIDAGYRLVIVLTGTTNMLRAQTQRRLDMELCGRENLEREISPHDERAHDYQDDPDWVQNRFIRHGGRPSDAGYPDVIRLSNHAGDYRRLRQGFSALEFERRERNRPFHEPANLFTSNARLVVAKKNARVLEALVADLGRISDRLGEVPVLIVDDESDQASVNTTNPAKWRRDRAQRTAINRHIGQLLRMMPRAQYVGYTATPYANVFIDPSDVEDIFPRDFILSLPRPTGYMGADDFHDRDHEVPIEQRPLTTSKERAHVRFLADEPDNGELRRALDMFVLTGAVKLYRHRYGAASYPHHTMLVHEAMDRGSHRGSADLITTLWNSGGYYTASGLARLRSLYETDVLPVSQAIASDLPIPADFDDLRTDIAEALALIKPADRDASPVIVVNSDTELERQQESLDFDKRRVWRILVGGNKLARGFTIEGLTVTYYRRTTRQVDTLMQMGRWFGFRPAYRDLVRLYTTRDLHAMFEAASQDEEYLRTELRRYATLADGRPQITPRQVPPLIAQHRPDLRPTGRNKMWNARLVEKSSPGEPMEPVAYPDKPTLMQRNNECWKPILASARVAVHFSVPNAGTSYEALVAIVSHADLLAVLDGITWIGEDTFKPDLAWLHSLTVDQLNRWTVILPHQVRSTARRTIFGYGPFSIFERKRTTTGSLAVASESRHRNAALRIAGIRTEWPDSAADALSDGSTAAIILYPVISPGTLGEHPETSVDSKKITIAFHAVTPMSTRPASGKLIKWMTRDSINQGAVAVDTNKFR